MSITKKAMVLNLQIGVWKGYRLDKEASIKVTEDAGADNDAARVNKHLVPKDALKSIITASNAVRLHFYAKTLPWKDNGDRLLTRLMFTDFIQEHERLVGNFKDAVDEFLVTSYPAAREQAAFRMGDLFKTDDYPSAESLRHRFYVNMDIDPVSEAGDFRVDMDKAELDEVRGQMEAALQSRIGRAMRDVWDRLIDVVEKFATRMDSDVKFHDTIVGNITELVDLLPGLNVLDDPDLAEMGEMIKKTLAGYDPAELRKDKEARSAAAKEAQEIMDRMKGFMGAFAPIKEAA